MPPKRRMRKAHRRLNVSLARRMPSGIGAPERRVGKADSRPPQKDLKNLQQENRLVARFVAVHTQFLKNTEYAEFVLEN